MYICIKCRFEIEADDIQIRQENSNRCVCIRCYARMVNVIWIDEEQPLRMPKDLRKWVTDVLNAVA